VHKVYFSAPNAEFAGSGGRAEERRFYVNDVSAYTSVSPLAFLALGIAPASRELKAMRNLSTRDMNGRFTPMHPSTAAGVDFRDRNAYLRMIRSPHTAAKSLFKFPTSHSVDLQFLRFLKRDSRYPKCLYRCPISCIWSCILILLSLTSVRTVVGRYKPDDWLWRCSTASIPCLSSTFAIYNPGPLCYSLEHPIIPTTSSFDKNG
jgi:hypothetical protein